MFQGLAYPFRINAPSGRVAVERDYERYIAALIRQLLMTRPGERINRPRMGGGARALVFAPLSDANAAIAQSAILGTLNDWLEALIRVEDVRVAARPPATLEITVVYLIRATGEQRFLNVEVTE